MSFIGHQHKPIRDIWTEDSCRLRKNGLLKSGGEVKTHKKYLSFESTQNLKSEFCTDVFRGTKCIGRSDLLYYKHVGKMQWIECAGGRGCKQNHLKRWRAERWRTNMQTPYWETKRNNFCVKKLCFQFGDTNFQYGSKQLILKPKTVTNYIWQDMFDLWCRKNIPYISDMYIINLLWIWPKELRKFIWAKGFAQNIINQNTWPKY